MPNQTTYYSRMAKSAPDKIAAIRPYTKHGTRVIDFGSGLNLDVAEFVAGRGGVYTSVDNERSVAKQLNYEVENRSVAGVASIVMRANDPNGACGVASDAVGVVGWWVNPQAPVIDACAQALKLMEQTLQTAA